MDFKKILSGRKCFCRPAIVLLVLPACIFCLSGFFSTGYVCAEDEDIYVLEDIKLAPLMNKDFEADTEKEEEIFQVSADAAPKEEELFKVPEGEGVPEAEGSSEKESPGEGKYSQEEEPSPETGDPDTGEDQKPKKQVEINGDVVEYSTEKNMIIAEGNVVIINADIKLLCDRVEFSRATDMAYATGHVRLMMNKGEDSEMMGDKLTFNFKTMKGTFDGATIYAKPYYGFGKEVAKVEENHMQMKDDYITTCDLDKPHYRLASKRMDIYPGETLIARHVRMIIGNIPLLYIPKFSQDLSSEKPMITFVPGYDKDWGAFLLSSTRYKFNENFKGIIHLDARERKDIAWGIDVDYKPGHYGEGSIRTYYMNERNITSKRFFEERPSPTIERERFKVEWRHKWEANDSTDAILQYYKLSDNTILKDYFEREYDEDSNPKTFFLLTQRLPAGTLSFLTEARVNRFVSAVERLPELRYDLVNQQIMSSGFYVASKTIYSNLTKKTPSPSEARTNTMRVDTDNRLSYPFKFSIFEMNPFVGEQNTYYSKTKDPDKYGAIRGIFKTGASMSTRFYRVFDTHIQRFGLDINRLRHIITPSASYAFNTKPTTTSDQLDSFDGIDSQDLNHSITFSLENKLQTKRNDQSVELLRAIISTDFNLKEDPGKGGFNKISTDIDFRPVDWITFYFDSKYDTLEEHLDTANFDMYINGGKKWTLGVSKRWHREVDDQLTTSLEYKLNPKWALRTYTRFDLLGGILKEQEYSVRRDLHAWTMDINFNETRTQGDEIWLVFTLKAFPDMAIDFGASFNKRKAGSQSSEGK